MLRENHNKKSMCVNYTTHPYAPTVFIPRKYSWYSFLLEAESTPGPQCDRKDYGNENFQ